MRKKISVEENDDDNKGQALKAYILSAYTHTTWAMTRHTTLEVTEDRSYESVKLAILRIFYERGTSRIMISYMEAAFRAIEKDYQRRTPKTLEK